MPTPNSGATAYAAPTDLMARADVRTLGDLCSDSTVRITPTGLLADANLLAALQDASGMVEAATMVGLKYQLTDLAALTGNGLAFLKRIVCDLAIGLLFQRRPDKGDPPKQFETANNVLAALEAGHMVFGILENQGAGNPTDQVESPQDVYARDGAAVIARRYFGTRGNQLSPPYGLGGG